MNVIIHYRRAKGFEVVTDGDSDWEVVRRARNLKSSTPYYDEESLFYYHHVVSYDIAATVPS